MRALLIGAAILLSSAAAADEVRCYGSYCATVVNGTILVPQGVLQSLTRAERLAALAYAKRHGLRWRIVR